MLRKRIITALIGGAGFLVVLYVGGPWIVLLAGVLAALAFGEWVRLKGVPFLSLPALLGWVALEGILLCTGGEGGLLRWIWPAGAVGDLDWWIWGSVVVFVLLPVFLGNEQTAEETAFVLLGVLYLGLLFRDFVWLRLSSENGWTVCLLILLSVWATDTAAYFVGSWIGGPKLAPALSPSKTVSGSMAGVVASVVPALVLAMSDIRPFPLYFMMLLGVIASLAGQLGDLAESAVKRAFGVKDSGQLLPGHGGILDRFDSLLLAGSVAYHLLLVLRF